MWWCSQALAGVSAMDKFEQLDLLLANNGGIVMTSDVLAVGVSKPSFYEYVKIRKLEKVARNLCFAGGMDGCYVCSQPPV